ncbi:LacI family transcriptional regulator [Trebonia kvetii]|uniref:LacI family transcriptional regulator n=1 Tax=Trebonia kvetii TaxID=2480626 RepID=A0A6P2BU96_9ACTN|nr:LacI family DNA-binding transcriptional regulator [Trebonia kvetii]TVZ02550.1 LacI family transcriptional regulator [Trebonia kvetii]
MSTGPGYQEATMAGDRETGPGVARTATLYDVARAAAVSTATVSRVINSSDPVRPATRRRVLAAIEELGYVPDGSAQSLAQRRKEVIGLLAVISRGPETDVERQGSLFIEEVLRGLESSVSDVGWSVLISFLRDSDPPSAYQRMLRMSAKVDGLVIAEDIVGRKQLAKLAVRVPIALIANDSRGVHADSIGVDNRSGTESMVRHMVERHGRTRLFYITGPAEALDALERRAAFDDAVASYPEVTVAGYYAGHFGAVSGQLAVRELLAGPRRDLPDAIICANDQTAIGAMRDLQAAGIRVPADIAVVGFDDMHVSALLTPPLTTVRQPMRELGERACSFLLERVADPALPPRAERLPTELIIRESCGCGPHSAAAAR